MAENKYMGKNFPTSLPAQADGVATKYLNLQGLADFWAKSKEYIDAQDIKLFNAAKAKIDANDAAMRTYVETLTVNGEKLTITKDQTSGLGTEMSVTIDAADIAVTYNGKEGSNITNPTIQTAIDDVDARLDAIQTELAEGVVSGLIVDTAHGTYGGGEPEAEKAWVSVTPVGTPSTPGKDGEDGTPDAYETGDIKIVIDDTAINAQFKKVDEEIATLTANAGVTNIAVKDVDSKDATNKQLVQISLEGTKEAVNPDSSLEGNGRRGDILITLDESGLDDKLDTIDSTIANETADRKFDVAALAGAGYTASANGNTDGAWAKTEDGKEFTVKYRDISSISERLANIDADLVTKITEGASTEKFVTLDIAGVDKTGDKEITITLNDSALQDYIEQNEENLTALNGLSINNKSIITVTEGDQVSVSASSVTLDTTDIKRTAGKQLEEQLAEYDSAIAALASATHFRGVYNSFAEAKASIGDSLDYGDVIIIGTKEYIYNADPAAEDYEYKENQWVELGDTTQENNRIQALETWVDTMIIQESEIRALFTTGGGFDFNAAPQA